MAGISPDKTIPSQKRLSEIGACESLVRVSQFSPPETNRGAERHLTPVQWQAIVKHSDASKGWAVAVRDDPDLAEADAKRLFLELYGKPEKVAKLAAERKAAQAKPKPPADVADEDLI